MKLIDKDAVLAEIRKLHDKHISPNYVDEAGVVLEKLEDAICLLEVKEVDLNEEIEKCLKRHSMLAVGKKDFTDIAKHFFELGLSVSNTKVTTPDIDDVLKENGVNPYSKEAKVFKESYYMAVSNKAQKGE